MNFELSLSLVVRPHCGRAVHQRVYKYFETYMGQLGLQAATTHAQSVRAALATNL